MGRNNFQTIRTPKSYSTCPGLSIKRTGRRLVTDNGTKCAWMIHESKTVQMHEHNCAASMCLGCLVALKNQHYNNNFWTLSFARKFDPVYSPADMSLFNWQYFLNNWKYLKIFKCILRKILNLYPAKKYSIFHEG